MKKVIVSGAFCLAVLAQVAAAYNYPLQFTPSAGYRGLVLAGYQFDGSGNVVGTCSYYTINGGSPKGGTGDIATVYSHTCTWDIYGNLVRNEPGSTLPQSGPISLNGTLVTYASNGNSSTGTDLTLGKGFVNTFGSHFTIGAPAGFITVTKGVIKSLNYTLQSDGDEAVNITAVSPVSSSGATVLVTSTDCSGSIAVGSSCSINLSYDASKVNTAAGSVADTLTVYITSSAQGSHNIIQPIAISQ